MLDPSFLSGLWTFSTLGWPGHTVLLGGKNDYASCQAYRRSTFSEVYCHSLARDTEGHKDVKSHQKTLSILLTLSRVLNYKLDMTNFSPDTLTQRKSPTQHIFKRLRSL